MLLYFSRSDATASFPASMLTGGRTSLSDAELFLGKRECCASLELYDRQLERIIGRFENALGGMESGEGDSRLALYREILVQLKELEAER